MSTEQSCETKCWTCQRGPRSGCSWFASHEPVPGWKAERRDVLVQSSTEKRGKRRNFRHYAESYLVIDCPLYLEDERQEKPPVHWDGPYWDAPVCMACYSRAVCMRTKGTCNRRVTGHGY